MKALRDVDEFLRRPVGHYFEGSTFVYWYPELGVNGISLRDCPNSEDIQQLTRLMDAVLPPTGGPHVSFIDARRLSHVEPAAFVSLARYLETRWEAFGLLIQRQALVRPAGLAGAVVAGFYDVLRPSYPARVFDDFDDALTWLGSDASRIAQSALSEIGAHEYGADPLLLSLRRLLERTPGKTSVAIAARELAVSERTLQRRLRAAATTFQDEVRNARVRASQTMMLTGEAKLTTIALEVGCASLQHYSSLFRRATGISPSAWRKRHASA
jgi:AraC-like DNA-binding protein